MKILNNQISLEKKVEAGSKIKATAPNWVKDGFAEMQKLGMSAQEAIMRLRYSPYFNDEWVSS
jgi:hypothetical protein